MDYSLASGAFEFVAVVLMPFNLAGICAEAPLRIRSLCYLSEGFEDSTVKAFRGKNPPGS